jgi:hypothetical protein
MTSSAWQELCAMLAAFNGRVTASATHEVKNSLAVMNEQAGLVRELLHKAQNGGQTDLARLESILGRLLERIKQADGVLRRLNLFAHQGDQSQGVVDIEESLLLAVESYRRLAEAREVQLECASAASGELETNPILLQAALFACLETMVAAAPAGATLRAVVRRGPQGVDFCFEAPLQDRGQAAPEPEPAFGLALGAVVHWDGDAGGLILRLPAGGK